MEPIRGKVAMVTGAARGIGRAVAVELGRRGAHLVICGRSTAGSPNKLLPGTLEESASAVEATGAEVLAIAANLAETDAVARLVEETNRRFGGCDIVVNNAAVTFPGPFLELPPRRWTSVFNVNVMAPVLLAHAFLPRMLERREGRILNLSSMAVLRNWPVLQAPYAVTKAGLECMTTVLAEEVSGVGVAINCIRIDEVVMTEVGEVLGGQSVMDAAKYDAPTFALAVAWLLSQPSTFSGEVLDFARLRALGALPAPNERDH